MSERTFKIVKNPYPDSYAVEIYRMRNNKKNEKELLRVRSPFTSEGAARQTMLDYFRIEYLYDKPEEQEIK